MKNSCALKAYDNFPILGGLVFLADLIISALDLVIQHGTFTFNATRIVGFALFVIGLSIYGVARFSLGKFFPESLRIKLNHKLITTGPYRFIRHPTYLGEIFYFFSIPIIFGSL